MKRTLLLALPLLLVACGEGPASKETPDKPAAAPSADLQASVDKGVAWLRAQAKDGIWFANFGGKEVPSPATTALALAPIAAALPKAERAKDPLVQKASGFLLKCQREDGAIDTGGTSKYENYFTSATLMALEIIDDPATADARKKMAAFLETLQRLEKGRTEGGFGYNTAGSADLSNAQFAIEALRSAGIPEDHPSMQRALRYLERVQNRSENAANEGAVYEMEDSELGKVKVVPGNDGSAGYEPGVSKAGLRKLPDGTYEPIGYGSMTYALLKCYLLTGLAPDDERVQATLSWLGENYGWEANPGFEDYARTRNQPEAPYWGLFYYYMTAAKALRLTGIDKLETEEGERDWRADLGGAITKRQQADGSWVNDKAQRWEEGDPVICTSYALIALQDILGVEK
jgi:squalene-hopene/tetraprenyl-beta-curcumene cyclase